MTSKARFRADLLDWRNSLSIETWNQKSQQICQHLLSLDQLKNASCVNVFWPISEKREVDIRPVVNQLFESGCAVFLPIVDGGRLKHGQFFGASYLKKGHYGVLEPVFDAEKEMPEPDVVLVQALAVDGLGNRIGYGKGYYDAFLSEVKSCKIVPLFAKQVVDGIPSEPHDVPVDILVTEEGVYPLK